MLAHIARTVVQELVTHFCEKCHFMWLYRRACESLLTAPGMRVAVSLTLFWFICLWMSAHTHNRHTEDIMPLWSQARVTESISSECCSELKWWANGCDTETKAPSLSLYLYWWFSVAGWIMSVTSTCRCSNNGLVLPSYAVTQYSSQSQCESFECRPSLPWNHSTCLHVSTHHQRTLQTHCVWLEINCGQCIFFGAMKV